MRKICFFEVNCFQPDFQKWLMRKKKRLFLRWNTSGSRCNTHCLKQQSLIFIFLIKCPETHSTFYFNMCIVLIKWINVCVCVWSVFIKQRPNLMFQQWVRLISCGTVHYCPLLVEELRDDQRTWTVWVNKNLLDVKWTDVVQWSLDTIPDQFSFLSLYGRLWCASEITSVNISVKPVSMES